MYQGVQTRTGRWRTMSEGGTIVVYTAWSVVLETRFGLVRARCLCEMITIQHVGLWDSAGEPRRTDAEQTEPEPGVCINSFPRKRRLVCDHGEDAGCACELPSLKIPSTERAPHFITPSSDAHLTAHHRPVPRDFQPRAPRARSTGTRIPVPALRILSLRYFNVCSGSGKG